MRLLALLIGGLACVCAVSATAQEVVRPDNREQYEHLVQEPPRVAMAWREGASSLLQQSYGGNWYVRLTVDETGAVSNVEILSGPAHHRDDAIVTARQTRFRPFEREGRAVPATLEYMIDSRPADYIGPADRVFPEEIDLASVRIRLQRTGCFGTCPGYAVEIRGDGEVIYWGEGYVLIRGEHRWRIPQSDVQSLLELMRRADYFRLQGHYEVNASDLPTYITGLEIGGQRKFVLNYGFSGMGGTMASTSMPGEAGPAMPPIVSEIEQAIDRVAGTARWVEGDDGTIEALRAEGFDFRSQNAGFALVQALANCNMALANIFITEGAPLEVSMYVGEPPLHVIGMAPRCGDMAFATALIERGALRRREVANRFLHASAVSGFPDMMRLALRYSRAVNARDGDSDPMLMGAVDAVDPREYNREPMPEARFDVGETVELLLRTGANARYRDDLMGWTPLHMTSDARVIRALIRAGAKANARDNDGRTPLFGEYDAAAAQALIDAGASVTVRDQNGRTPLHAVGGGDVVPVLIAAGADIEARDTRGLTPVETVNDQGAAQALLAAGARLPDDPARIAALVRRARHTAWTELAPVFEAHARSLGVVIDEPAP